VEEGRILLVDDERDLVWAIRHNLSDEGYEVFEAYDGIDALEIARRHRPDLVVLDVVMPRMDGFTVCEHLRRDVTLASVPILFLTARSAVEDRIRGLEEGADDYLAKPFDLRELRARVKALLRRSRGREEGALEVMSRGTLVAGDLALDVGRRQLVVGGKVVRLTPAEFSLIHFLMGHPGEVFSGRDLLQQVWGYPPAAVESGLVRWHVKNLRDKLEPDPSHPRYLCTIAAHGYVLRETPEPQD
jgi:DNA-binding response OmpR family regulator